MPVPSLQSRLLNGLLRILRLKRRWRSAAVVQAHVRRLAVRPASHRPSGLGRDVAVTLRSWADWPVYHTTPSANPAAKNHVFFLHGGGYINEIVRGHWRFIGWLTRYAPAYCTVPIFPLAPRGTAKHVVPAVGHLLRELLQTAGPENVSLIGNSAGAGLALAAAQWLRDSGFAQPKTMVLISPLLDASVSGQEHAAIAPRDPMLNIPGLAEAGRLYAGDLDICHPLVSPLQGDLGRLAPMVVFTGTHDLLHPDSVALANKARQTGVPIELQVQSGLPHSYAMLPTPEGRAARAIIARAVTH
jgi:monoterpene epsilon-lactone hydrolase